MEDFISIGECLPEKTGAPPEGTGSCVPVMAQRLMNLVTFEEGRIRITNGSLPAMSEEVQPPPSFPRDPEKVDRVRPVHQGPLCKNITGGHQWQ